MILYYMVIFLAPFYFHPILNQVVGGFTVVKLIGIAAVVYALIYRIRKGNIPNFLSGRQAKLFLALCVLAFLSAGRVSGTVEAAYEASLGYLSFLVFFFITLSVVDTPQRVRTTLLVCLATIGFASLYVIREYLKYSVKYESFRPGLVVGDANYYTLSAMLVLPVAYCWHRSETKPMFRWAALATLGVTVVGISLAASRAVLVALPVLILVVALGTRSRLRTVVVLVLLAVTPMLFLPKSPLRRVLDPGHGDNLSTQKRLALLQAGVSMVRDHPFLGIGLGRYKPVSEKYLDGSLQGQIAHNTYLQFAAEMGIVAMLLYAWLLWETFVALGWIRKQAYQLQDRFLAHAATGMQAGVAGFAVGALFLSAQYQKLFWIYVFLSICLVTLVREEIQRRKAPAVV